ncbi:hypothetical protein Pelo_16548 [Pelomyxa schiedti]|nr:hypothetical protein Pelo_16548 [Pelomyxa schiedti]
MGASSAVQQKAVIPLEEEVQLLHTSGAGICSRVKFAGKGTMFADIALPIIPLSYITESFKFQINCRGEQPGGFFYVNGFNPLEEFRNIYELHALIAAREDEIPIEVALSCVRPVVKFSCRYRYGASPASVVHDKVQRGGAVALTGKIKSESFGHRTEPENARAQRNRFEPPLRLRSGLSVLELGSEHSVRIVCSSRKVCQTLYLPTLPSCNLKH